MTSGSLETLLCLSQFFRFDDDSLLSEVHFFPFACVCQEETESLLYSCVHLFCSLPLSLLPVAAFKLWNRISYLFDFRLSLCFFLFYFSVALYWNSTTLLHSFSFLTSILLHTVFTCIVPTLEKQKRKRNRKTSPIQPQSRPKPAGQGGA